MSTLTHLTNNEYGYLGNPLVKRDGVEQTFSQEELQEYIQKLKDHVGS